MISTQDIIEKGRERLKYKEKVMTCERFDYKSSSKTLLTRHKQAVHQAKQYLFDQCGRKFHSKTFLKGHVSTVHEATKLNCDKCDYNTTTK